MRCSATPLLNTQQAAEYLGYDVAHDRAHALKAFREFARRHRLPKYHRGSRVLFRCEDLDQVIGFVNDPAPLDPNSRSEAAEP